jgi:DNA-binding NtrC family response regulator
MELAKSFLGEASGLLQRFEEELGEERTASLNRYLNELEEYLHESRRALEGKKPSGRTPVRVNALLGYSAVIENVRNLVRQIGPSMLPVLITGETGTGKELVARTIHGESSRSGGPFVSLNCAALPAELLGAELFGYEQGAFTGAESDSEGLLASALGGTFFFDEIAELPMGLQGKILRLLDDRRFRRLGATEEIEIDARFVFSTSQNLRALVGEGKLRSDLFYRLSAVEVPIPPLRDRIEDLPPLVEHFRSMAVVESDAPLFAEDALRALATHLWPGNIRQLRAIVTRLVLTSRGRIRADDVRSILEEIPTRGLFTSAMLRSWPLDRLRSHLERDYFLQLFLDCRKDVKAMAAKLGISHQALYKRFKALNIRPRDLR